MISKTLGYFDSTLCSSIIVFTITVFVYFYFKSKQSRIPGPFCLPIVGYLPFLDNEPHKTFTKLADKYGNVFRLQLGMVDVVFLSDLEAIKEAFSKEELLARPEDTIFSTFHENLSFGSLEGPEWRLQRRFAMRTLKDLGLARAAMEDHITNSIDEICSYVDEANGEPKHMLQTMYASTLNILLAFMTGKRLKFNDPQIMKVVHAAFSNENSTSLVDLAAFFPLFSQICAKLGLFGFDKFQYLVQTLTVFSDERVKDVEKDADERSRRACFVAQYLDEIDVAEQSGTESTFTRNRLVDTLYDFIFASTDTTGTLISWILICACAFSECQKKVQQEIDAIVGSQRLPYMSDRKSLIYSQAFILEVQRWRCFIPINMPRRTLDAVIVQGMKIAKDTQILANFYAVHRSNKLWEKADEFIPERFISDDGKRIINTDKVLTFSYGKRSCPGEGLANAELFLYTTHLLQKYTIETVDGLKPSMDYKIGISMQPKRMNLKFIKRK